MSLELEKSSSSFSTDQDNQIHSDLKNVSEAIWDKKNYIEFFLPIRQYDDKSEGLRLDQNISTLVAAHI